ncbi:MAG: DNA adenine methylase [Bacilli bacterium]|jgi:adenine-specific DNA-methyltransferase|nr:DNA adenine methylase [Bacilli bacterium]
MGFDIQNRRYTGSKQKLVKWIRGIITKKCDNVNSFCDLFAGTGVVTNALINDFNTFYINDFLYSNFIIYNAFFSSDSYSEEKLFVLKRQIETIDPRNVKSNYVSKNFGGKFFSKNDSLVIGEIRELLENEKKTDRINFREFCILLSSLIYSFDRCANTVGHYDAYIKKPILKDTFVFELINPVITNQKEKKFFISCKDSNQFVREIQPDVVYIDPPYSSRQYSRFYHVIENIAEWKKPKLYGTALKPAPENMSDYCTVKAIDAFRELVADLHCKYIVASYNNTYDSKSNSSKNKMELEDMKKILDLKGHTTIFDINHKAFNAGKTDLKNHKELLFLTKVGEHDE